MILEKEIILNTTTTTNGRRYTLEALQHAVHQINNHQTKSFGCIGHPEHLVIDLHKASHVATNATVIGETMYADIEILSTSEGVKLADHVSNFVFRPGFIYDGSGENKVIDAPGLTLVGVFAVLKSEDAVVLDNESYVLNETNYDTTI